MYATGGYGGGDSGGDGVGDGGIDGELRSIGLSKEELIEMPTRELNKTLKVVRNYLHCFAPRIIASFILQTATLSSDFAGDTAVPRGHEAHQGSSADTQEPRIRRIL